MCVINLGCVSGNQFTVKISSHHTIWNWFGDFKITTCSGAVCGAGAMPTGSLPHSTPAPNSPAPAPADGYVETVGYCRPGGDKDGSFDGYR